MRRPGTRALGVVAWMVVLLAAHLALLQLRARLDKAHVALVFLLVVLGASASRGRGLGLAIAGAAFLLFDWAFLPPYGGLTIADPFDWLVLFTFLVTSVVATQLLARAQQEAAHARSRAEEIDRIAAVGAETLNAVRAEDALDAIATVIRSTTGIAECTIVGGAPASDEPTRSDLVAWVLRNGVPAAEQRDGTTRLSGPGDSARAITTRDARAILLPLRVRDRTVGVLRAGNPTGLLLGAGGWRVLEALAYYAALAVDRAQLARAAEHADALREADRLKDALLASVSHDLRTPLTTIKALAHEIADGGDERAVTIAEEADRLNRTVADLLDLARLNGGALVLHVELNAADELLGAVIERVPAALGTRRLDVVLDDRGELMLGRFDLVHSLRVLANLVENAAKYSPPGSVVTLRAWRDGDMLAFEVLDRGPGIDAADASRIFEPFYRTRGTLPDVAGTGLGLAIARRLAEAQGGTLTYAPRAADGGGGGSCFTYRVPAADSEQAADESS